MAYQAQEDRILLRVLSTDRAEFRFWMTRRYVKLLWTVFLKMLEMDPKTVVQAEPAVRRAVIDMQHSAAVEKGKDKLAKPFEEGAAVMPLGDAPILLSRVSGKRPPNQPGQLSLHPEQGQGIDLGVDTNLLHMLSKLVVDAVAQSDWDIKLAIDPNGLATPQAQGVPPHKLN